jgi:hypothetical protein
MLWRYTFLFLLACNLILSAAASDAAPDDEARPLIIVVCPEVFRPAMEPWRMRREAQQNRVVFVSNRGSADDIRSRIREAAAKDKPRAVVLVGDAPAISATRIATAPHQTPTFSVAAKVNKYWGGDTEFVSDNPYADLDDDLVPDTAIGRLPADSIG